ncbi:MAG: hypothetical protein RL242_2749, partial [Pseudomonadota bacterium]
DEARAGRAVGAGLHLHLERLFLGHRADPRAGQPAGNRWDHGLQLAVSRCLSHDERGQHRGGLAAGADVFHDAKAFHCRSDYGSYQGIITNRTTKIIDKMRFEMIRKRNF